MAVTETALGELGIVLGGDQLETGETSEVRSPRIDHMPYGGVKSSGLGREGIRYAIEEMTEPKLLTTNRSS